jgi:hypothetical protein
MENKKQDTTTRIRMTIPLRKREQKCRLETDFLKKNDESEHMQKTLSSNDESRRSISMPFAASQHERIFTTRQPS